MIEKMLLFFFGTMVGDSERPHEVLSLIHI